MQPDELSPLTESDIAEYLFNNPGFFQRNQELLISLQLGSAHGQRVVSLHERQAEMLREKIKILENRLVSLIRQGSENSITTSRLLDFATRLHLIHNPVALPETICQELKTRFMVPQAAIRLWNVADRYAHEPFTQDVNDSIKSFASSLADPYCGMHVSSEAVRWLEEPLLAASLALIPLRDIEKPKSATFGLLVLASPDANRYQDDMATDYLKHIGDMTSAALSRLISYTTVLEQDTILIDEPDLDLDSSIMQSTL